MHQTTRQITRRPAFITRRIIYQDLQLKCPKKQRAQELTTANCMLMLQGRVGAHKLGVVGNTTYFYCKFPQA